MRRQAVHFAEIASACHRPKKTLNSCGFDAWIEVANCARLEIETNQVSGGLELKNIGLDDTVLDTGDLDLCVLCRCA